MPTTPPTAPPTTPPTAGPTPPEMARDFDWDSLAKALTRTADAREGFQKMAELARPEFAPTVSRFLSLHSRHSEALARILAEAGQEPDLDGSLMGTVNRLVVTARATLDEIDADVLPQIHSGEAYVLEAYRAAAEARVPEAVRTRLFAMCDELTQLLDETPAPA